jgi:hypothetical protein
MKKTPALWTPPDDFTDPEGQTIDAIEYQKRGKHWYPHAIFADRCCYDFEFCHKVGTLAYHMSGGGVGPYFGKYCNAPKICAKVWLRDGATAVLDSGKGKITNWSELGIQRIAIPLMDPSGSGSLNPFDWHCSKESDTVYCDVCGARYPSDDRCCHLWYDDDDNEVGCGFSDCDIDAAKDSVFRILETFTAAGIDDLEKSVRSKFGPDDDTIGGDYEYEHNAKRFYAGAGWLFSLDAKAKGPVNLTLGWIWEFRRQQFRHSLVISEKTLWLTPKDVANTADLLSLESGEAIRHPSAKYSIAVKHPRKVESAHDAFFNKAPSQVRQIRIYESSSEIDIKLTVAEATYDAAAKTVTFIPGRRLT